VRALRDELRGPAVAGTGTKLQPETRTTATTTTGARCIET